MKSIVIATPSGFRLGAAREFYAGFIPGSGMAAADAERLTFAFHLDRSFEAVAVALREERGALVADLAGTDDEASVRKQLARLLGLEGDAEAWWALGARVPLVGRLQREFPGFLTAAKASPYDAAVWSVIAPRLNMKVAAQIKTALAQSHGTAVTLQGRTHHVFPGPRALGSLKHAPGLSDEKVARLRAVAHAAEDGWLDPDALRAMGEGEALRRLQTIRGIGPWSAGHIFHRGAAPQDALPLAEPRVVHGLAAASGEPVVDAAAFVRAAEEWRPFRMWVCVLLSRHLARTDGWRAASLARERAAAGRALARNARQASPSGP